MKTWKILGHSLHNPLLFKEGILNIAQSFFFFWSTPSFCFIQKFGVKYCGRERRLFSEMKIIFRNEDSIRHVKAEIIQHNRPITKRNGEVFKSEGK